MNRNIAYSNLLTDALINYGWRQHRREITADVARLFENPALATEVIATIDQRLKTIKFRGHNAKNERIEPILTRLYGLNGKRETQRAIARDLGVTGNTVRVTKNNAMRRFFGREQSPELFALLARHLT